MIEQKTLFILGAGASVPYKFPTAQGLKEYILRRFGGDLESLYLNEVSNNRDDFRDRRRFISGFCKKFKQDPSASIDLFLSRNQQYFEIGKQAILLSILDFEKKSSFGLDIPIENRAYDWYTYLYRAMTESITNSDKIDDFSNNNVQFLTFNYDRSWEYFLLTSLQSSFSQVNYEKAESILSNIEIRHVYGHPYLYGENKIDYGEKLTFNKLVELAQNISTIHEVQQNQKFDDMIKWADQIFILGFGFASENLQLIGLPELLNTDQKIFATAYKLDERICRNTKNSFYQDFAPKFYLRQHYRLTPKQYDTSNFKFETVLESVGLLSKYLE
jgi:hypothetical protein